MFIMANENTLTSFYLTLFIIMLKNGKTYLLCLAVFTYAFTKNVRPSETKSSFLINLMKKKVAPKFSSEMLSLEYQLNCGSLNSNFLNRRVQVIVNISSGSFIVLLEPLFVSFDFPTGLSCFKIISRSNHPTVFCKKGVLRNFAKSKRKHLRHSLYFNKIADLMIATSLKNRVWYRRFPVNFAKFLRTSFLT